MKKAIALVLVISTFIFILAACGGDSKLDGKYENDKASFEFKNDKDVTYKSGETDAKDIKGTFTIKDDKDVTFTWEGEDDAVKALKTTGTYDKATNKLTFDGKDYAKK